MFAKERDPSVVDQDRIAGAYDVAVVALTLGANKEVLRDERSAAPKTTVGVVHVSRVFHKAVARWNARPAVGGVDHNLYRGVFPSELGHVRARNTKLGPLHKHIAESHMMCPLSVAVNKILVKLAEKKDTNSRPYPRLLSWTPGGYPSLSS